MRRVNSMCQELDIVQRAITYLVDSYEATLPVTPDRATTIVSYSLTQAESTFDDRCEHSNVNENLL